MFGGLGFTIEVVLVWCVDWLWCHMWVGVQGLCVLMFWTAAEIWMCLWRCVCMLLFCLVVFSVVMYSEKL